MGEAYGKVIMLPLFGQKMSDRFTHFSFYALNEGDAIDNQTLKILFAWLSPRFWPSPVHWPRTSLQQVKREIWTLKSVYWFSGWWLRVLSPEDQYDIQETGIFSGVWQFCSFVVSLQTSSVYSGFLCAMCDDSADIKEPPRAKIRCMRDWKGRCVIASPPAGVPQSLISSTHNVQGVLLFPGIGGDNPAEMSVVGVICSTGVWSASPRAAHWGH